MKLYTSFYGNLRNIPRDYFLVSVSVGLTEELKVSVDSWDIDLAPSMNILNDYKKSENWGKYTHSFKMDILSKIDWLEKLEHWEEKAKKIKKTMDNIVLFCYEKPTDHCHRHILAEHFENDFKCSVKEFGHEHMIRDNYRLINSSSLDILF